MRNTRREVLKIGGATAIASAGAAAAPSARIDCQSHLFSEEYLKLLEKRKESPYVVREGKDRYVIVGE